MTLRIDILTLFPDMFAPVLGTSIVGRAIAQGLVDVHVHDIRKWSVGRDAGGHNKVDDRPFGGGPGMVFMCEPLSAAVEAVDAHDPRPARRILLSPAGKKFAQHDAAVIAESQRIMLICGHYEGIDQRAIDELALEEISIGDFVLSGGELPALAIVDAVARLIPGALGHQDSAAEDSFSKTTDAGAPLLDCPHYTRPREWRGHIVPDVLLSGDHQAIARWRLEESIKRTRQRRPDLESLHAQPLEGEASMLQGTVGLFQSGSCCTSTVLPGRNAHERSHT
ncbi:MAG: tRNA (guanosine(37)-N1)-methyltransferase TrmD [Phycisphaerales bacterium]|nr:tRNA (guanosine(37)-N1)-methyltransferase TrmD [Phycisphaerales bacterium]